jgi:transposase
VDGPLAASTCQAGALANHQEQGAIHERDYDDWPGSSFQVHGIDAEGTTVLRKRVRRGQVLAFLSRIPRCVVGLEACATAHYWARELGALGHEVRLMPAQYVKAYIKRNKHDAADAEAICEAVQRPTMRFVPVKTTKQQATALLHRGREQLVRQRTMLVNALRAHLAEFGIVAAQGLRNVGDRATARPGGGADSSAGRRHSREPPCGARGQGCHHDGADRIRDRQRLSGLHHHYVRI